MATFTIPRLTYLRSPSVALVPVSTMPTVAAPVTNMVVGWWRNAITGRVVQGTQTNVPDRTFGWSWSRTAPAAPVPVVVKATPYLPSIAPRIEPVIYQTMPAPASPPPVVAPEPAPLVPHKFSTCATCGEEKVTDIATAPAPVLMAPAPTPAAPAPTPAPATPTAEPKAKAGKGWILAFAVLALLVGGLALASAVRPRK